VSFKSFKIKPVLKPSAKKSFHFSNVFNWQQSRFPTRQLANPIVPPSHAGRAGAVVMAGAWHGLKPLFRGHGDGRGCVRPADARRACGLAVHHGRGDGSTPHPLRSLLKLFRSKSGCGADSPARVCIVILLLHGKTLCFSLNFNGLQCVICGCGITKALIPLRFMRFRWVCRWCMMPGTTLPQICPTGRLRMLPNLCGV